MCDCVCSWKSLNFYTIHCTCHKSIEEKWMFVRLFSARFFCLRCIFAKKLHLYRSRSRPVFRLQLPNASLLEASNFTGERPKGDTLDVIPRDFLTLSYLNLLSHVPRRKAPFVRGFRNQKLDDIDDFLWFIEVCITSLLSLRAQSCRQFKQASAVLIQPLLAEGGAQRYEQKPMVPLRRP